MKGGILKNEPLFKISASWDSPLSPKEVLESLSRAFFVEEVTVDAQTNAVEVKSGSNFLYRMWGEALNGYKNAPVTLLLKVHPADDGSRVEVSAFDTFGFRLTNRLFGGAGKTFKSKLIDLMETASSAVQPRNPGWS